MHENVSVEHRSIFLSLAEVGELKFVVNVQSSAQAVLENTPTSDTFAESYCLLVLKSVRKQPTPIQFFKELTSRLSAIIDAFFSTNPVNVFVAA